MELPNEYLAITVDGNRYGYLAHAIEPILPQIADHFLGSALTGVEVEKMVDGLWRLDTERTMIVRRQLVELWKPYKHGLTCPPAT